RLRILARAFPGFTGRSFVVPSEDGQELYEFSPQGRHLRTVSAYTGADVYRFSYDAGGHLIRIEDGDGNVTTIEHGGNGTPAAIVGPYGHRTTLAFDGNGHLSRITDPAVQTYVLTSSTDGLLSSLT